MTTKDILKETLGSLNFPDAAWDELAEKIDNNSRGVSEEITQIGNPEDCATDCVGPDCEGCRKFVPKKIGGKHENIPMETVFLANSKINLERGCKVMTFDEFKTALSDMVFIKRLNEPVDTPDDIKEFVGEAKYDDHGQLIFRGADKDNLQQFLDVRGWGSIQNMGFKTQQEAMDFQDKVGRWVTDVINNNLK